MKKEVDNYAIQTYRDCPRSSYWRIERGIVKVKEVAISANFGASIHTALETYYKSGMTQKGIDQAMIEFATEFAQYESFADNKRTVSKGLDILGKYFERYHNNEPFNVVATEVGGAFELDDYVYRTRMDLIVEWISPKGIYVIDHKTSSDIQRLIAKPHNQLTGYEYNVREMYTDVLGSMLNILGVYESDEIIDKNAPKVQSEKSNKLIYAKKKREIFIRIPTSRTPLELEQWKDDVLWTLHQIEESRETGKWPKYAPEFCTAFRRRCMYVDLCNCALSETAEKMIADGGLYEYRPWVPYESETTLGEEE